MILSATTRSGRRTEPWADRTRAEASPPEPLRQPYCADSDFASRIRLIASAR